MRLCMIILACVIGCGRGEKATPSASTASGTPAKTADATAVPAIPAPNLWLEYGENQAAADGKYLGKKVVTGGSVTLVRQDEKGYYIGFTVVESAFGVEYPAGVICYLAAGEEKAASALKPNESSTAKGTCAGMKNDARAYKGYIVVFNECKILGEAELKELNDAPRRMAEAVALAYLKTIAKDPRIMHIDEDRFGDLVLFVSYKDMPSGATTRINLLVKDGKVIRASRFEGEISQAENADKLRKP